MSQPPYPPPYQDQPEPGHGYPPPSYGQPDPGPSQYGQPGPGPSQYGQPGPEPSQYGQPGPEPSQYGQPGPGPSQYGQPGPGPSQYGQPGPGPSQYGQPGPGPSQYGQPSHGGQSSFGQPSHGGQSSYGQPDLGQPGYGQPPPFGTPQFGAPPFGQPPFGTPQFGQPPFGQPPFGAPAPKKSNNLKIVLGIVGAFVLLCAVGGMVLVVQARDTVGQVVDASRITVVEPTTLAGREKITDSAVASRMASLTDELARIPGSTGSVGAAYGDVQEQDIVMVGAASSLRGSAQNRFDEFVVDLGKGGLDVNGLTDTGPGPLGGIAQCGEADVGGVPAAVCVWSDNGSVGLITMLFKKKADLEKEFVTMRGQVEQKS